MGLRKILTDKDPALHKVCKPVTAFDEKLGRMGMGAGYYDRFLTACKKAHIVAVAFECQKADSVMAQEWDMPMEKVFTEEKVYG
jgi:5-formyltetrahydrofolate cyclo-ligase